MPRKFPVLFLGETISRRPVLAGLSGDSSHQALPNGLRLSCGAMLYSSQTDGLHRKPRRQLQARVRQRHHDFN